MNEHFEAIIKAMPLFSGVYVSAEHVVYKLRNPKYAAQSASEANQIIKRMQLPLVALHHPITSNTFYITLNKN